jgi:TonB family protein
MSVVRPIYPPAALRLRLSGVARIEVEVDPRGRVRRVTVLEETGRWGFGEAARDAFAAARFTPPRLQGRPVRVLWHKTVIFQP